MDKTIRNEALIESYNLGYRIINGILYNPKNTVVDGMLSKSGYKFYSFRCSNHTKKSTSVYYHRLVALQKYGTKIFEKDIVVRHLDGNKINNSIENIVIGSQSDNMFDVPKDIRICRTKKSIVKTLKLTHDVVLSIQNDYKKTQSYKYITEKYGISKSTAHKAIHIDLLNYKPI